MNCKDMQKLLIVCLYGIPMQCEGARVHNYAHLLDEWMYVHCLSMYQPGFVLNGKLQPKHVTSVC
jgi:hypothetical protein